MSLEAYNRRVIVTGSRNWTDRQFVYDMLGLVAAEVRGDELTVVEGGCDTGADLFARDWVSVTRMYGRGVYLVSETHYAPWKAHGRAAGMWRNRRMCDKGADYLLAFAMPCSKPGCTRATITTQGNTHDSHGTADCLTYGSKTIADVRTYRR